MTLGDVLNFITEHSNLTWVDYRDTGKKKNRVFKREASQSDFDSF
jgi:hypothetical protein